LNAMTTFSMRTSERRGTLAFRIAGQDTKPAVRNLTKVRRPTFPTISSRLPQQVRRRLEKDLCRQIGSPLRAGQHRDDFHKSRPLLGMKL
jgi:hypothetical protein